MQIESVLETKNWSEPAKNRFSVALVKTLVQVDFPVYAHAKSLFKSNHEKNG